MRSNCRKSKCGKYLAAFFSRIFFAGHAICMIATLEIAIPDKGYKYLSYILLLFFIEMIITLVFTEKGEWKWFSPMVFIYLCSVIPAVFIMEHTLIEFGLENTNTTNMTSEGKQELVEFLSHRLLWEEQFLILVLVIGRWLMPKGNLNRNQLSQLLLIYLGLGADILDILQLMKEKAVRTHKNVSIVGLCLFCWTISQFTFVHTPEEETPKSQKTSVTEDSYSDIKMQCHRRAEVESFLMAIGIQDGPLLVFRVYVLLVVGEANNSIYFFTCKNILALMIEMYKLVATLCNDRNFNVKNEQDVLQSDSGDVQQFDSWELGVRDEKT